MKITRCGRGEKVRDGVNKEESEWRMEEGKENVWIQKYVKSKLQKPDPGVSTVKTFSVYSTVSVSFVPYERERGRERKRERERVTSTSCDLWTLITKECGCNFPLLPIRIQDGGPNSQWGGPDWQRADQSEHGKQNLGQWERRVSPNWKEPRSTSLSLWWSPRCGCCVVARGHCNTVSCSRAAQCPSPENVAYRIRDILQCDGSQLIWYGSLTRRSIFLTYGDPDPIPPKL